MQNLYFDLDKLLKGNKDFVVNDKLNKNRIVDSAYKYSETLMKILLSNEGLKKQFFRDVGGTTIFMQREFLNFLNNKSFLKDSYTEFKNQIGLQDDKGEYFRENKGVILVFPYKDCVLEGGQDKEEQKRDEIFFNETLAPDEITRLFDTKVLTNFKHYSSKGEHTLTAKSEIDFSKQNLIIKGNNLLALHSLKKIKSIAGQVKLIYIDPPYNTGNDSFHYNDKFNHSTWLVFMKNRLEAAKELLKPEGVICINIDDKEAFYLKALVDEIFGRENFLTNIIIKTSDPSGHKTVNPAPYSQSEYILMYAKNKKKYKYDIFYIPSGYDTGYSKYIPNINDSYNKWKINNLAETVANKNGYATTKDAKKMMGEYVFKSLIADFALENKENVFQLTAIADDAGKDIVSIRDKSKVANGVIFKVERNNKEPVYIYEGRQIYFYSSKVKTIDGVITPAKPLTNIWTDIAYNGIANEGGVSLKNGKKPEKLLRRIIEITTKEGDIVMDYHLGSGTTAAVAHKLKRRYIGLEQLDYENNGSVTRLNNVINGDSTGISKVVNWQGGGSFVYAELKRYNQFYIDEIEKVKNTNILSELYEQMKKEAFFRIEVEHSKWDKEYFEQLKLQEQKELLCECLDKNHLYVNLSEMEDAHYKMNKNEIALNKKFYNIL
jgi:adenine-specific DNA-methyltransferase